MLLGNISFIFNIYYNIVISIALQCVPNLSFFFFFWRILSKFSEEYVFYFRILHYVFLRDYLFH